MLFFNSKLTQLNLFWLLMLISGCAKQQTKVDYKTKEAFFSAQETDATLTEAEKNDALVIPTKQMSFAQANYAKKYYKQIKDPFMYQKCAERILALGGDQETVSKTTLELAQMSLDDGDYAKAQKYATQYQKLYPGSRELEYAYYINIKSHFLDTLNSERDQTQTNKTIELAKNFLKDNNESDYSDSVKDILESCYQKLITSELRIAQTYINKFKYSKQETSLDAAQGRINYVKEKLMPEALFTEGLIINTEIKLAQAKNDFNTVKLKQKELEQKYPNGIPQLASTKNQTFLQKIKEFVVS